MKLTKYLKFIKGAVFSFALVWAALFVGCSTISPTNSVDPSIPVPGYPDYVTPDLIKWKTALTVSAQLGSYFATRDNPDLIPYFREAKNRIQFIISSREKTAPELLQQILMQTTGDSNLDEGYLAIAGAVALYDTFLGNRQDLPVDSYLFLLGGLAEGLELGIGSPSSTEKTFGLPSK